MTMEKKEKVENNNVEKEKCRRRKYKGRKRMNRTTMKKEEKKMLGNRGRLMVKLLKVGQGQWCENRM